MYEQYESIQTVLTKAQININKNYPTWQHDYNNSFSQVIDNVFRPLSYVQPLDVSYIVDIINLLFAWHI